MRLPGPVLGAWLLTAGAPAGEAREPRPFPCCDDPWVARVVGEYVDVGDALDRGDARNRVGWHVQQLVRALSAPARLAAWEEDLTRKALALASGLERAELTEIRRGYAELSRSLSVLALHHEGGDQLVVEAWCPDRGPWLQDPAPRPRNPYGSDDCARWR